MKRLSLLLIIGMSIVIATNFTSKIKGHAVENKSERVILSTPGFNLADLVEKVSPAVVRIREDLIDMNGNPVAFVGSGFFISPTTLLTNAHVIAGKQLPDDEKKVVLKDGTELEFELIGRDIVDDIALIEITTPGFKSPNYLKLGSSKDARVGDWIITIGTPYKDSFVSSAGIGVISGKSRLMKNEDGIVEYLQIDATLNSGNSGGPLINLNGEVIGINSAKLAKDANDSVGISYPIDNAKIKIEEFINPPIDIGISGVNLTNNLGSSKGFLVLGVMEKSIGSEIGIIPGDIVIEVNGIKADTIEKIKEARKKSKEELTLKVLRGNENINLKGKIK